MILGVLGRGNAVLEQENFLFGKARVYIYHNTCLILVVSGKDAHPLWEGRRLQDEVV